ncbi:MAG: HPr family phosphocarrier protein [Eubacteriales bacterium]|nr:HPr family phosphocarrier protein [Eubacteriales bacterium]
MVSQTVKVNNKTGLHARPAALFSKLANTFPCEVSVEKDGKTINAKSILGVLSLAIVMESEITIITDGENEEVALAKMVEFVKNLDE